MKWWLLALLMLGSFIAGVFVYRALGPDKRREYLIALLLLVFICGWILDVKVQRDLLAPQLIGEGVNLVISNNYCFSKNGTIPMELWGKPESNAQIADSFGLNFSGNSSGPGSRPG